MFTLVIHFMQGGFLYYRKCVALSFNKNLNTGNTK